MLSSMANTKFQGCTVNMPHSQAPWYSFSHICKAKPQNFLPDSMATLFVTAQPTQFSELTPCSSSDSLPPRHPCLLLTAVSSCHCSRATLTSRGLISKCLHAVNPSWALGWVCGLSFSFPWPGSFLWEGIAKVSPLASQAGRDGSKK